ncbi:DUF4321 domain-containing protein [Vallitalea guaymasensis]|uniref:DUF4321 domain-containing protein n=1 Tax=Vallitalea guaymasensis TaxID=1185412 RepID=A0A8J8MFA1_9FIRM|nr:DUF4321 domain-containing protein [Vallitalea guaymasensis]QUH31550.1 DUF4321 domain-containing protein [Vallitalea guaymasensis]
MSYRRTNKNGWALFLLILAGIVLGGFLGSLAKNVEWLRWLNYGLEFGMENPVKLNLEVLVLVLQLNFKITITSILGIIAGILVYRKL